jgi:hypothetical protein
VLRPARAGDLVGELAHQAGEAAAQRVGELVLERQRGHRRSIADLYRCAILAKLT